MLIGGPTPLLCCTASWAIRRSRKSDNFRPEKPCYRRCNQQVGVHMWGRLLSFVAVGLLAFAGTALAQGKAELQWFSQAGFKLTTPGGKVIMIDPWIKGATKLPEEFKDLGKLGKIDLILVTHGHGDHLGDAMEIAKTNDVPMWAPAGLNQTLLTLGLMPAK